MKHLFLVPAIILFSLNTFAQKVNFKLNPTLNNSFSYDLKNKMDIDGAQSMIMTLDMLLEINPTKIEGENITLENVAKNVKVEINTGMNSMTYDSQKEPETDIEEMLASEFSILLDKKISTVVNNKGQLIDIELSDDLKQVISERNFAGIYSAFPANEVSVGDSWVNPVIEDNQFGKIESSSTFSEITDSGYKIDLKGKIIGPNGSELGEISSTSIIDKKTFLANSTNTTISVEMEGTKIVSELTITKK